jgi:hypothetical protein
MSSANITVDRLPETLGLVAQRFQRRDKGF